MGLMDNEKPAGPAGRGYYDVMPEAMARKFKNLGPDKLRVCGTCGEKHGCPFCNDDGLIVACLDADRVEQYAPCPFCQHGHAVEFGCWPAPVLTRDRKPKVDEHGDVIWQLHREARPHWGTKGFWRDKDVGQVTRRCSKEGLKSWDEVKLELAAWATENGYLKGLEVVAGIFEPGWKGRA